MTNLEALKGTLSYPLPSAFSYSVALMNRGLSESGVYAIENRRSLDLSYADCIYTILTTPNISEGGYSISFSDKEVLLTIASGIYAKYGEKNPFNATVKFVQKW